MAKLTKLGVGDAAPGGTCLDVNGQEVAITKLWQEGPILLTFLRHFG